MSPVLSDGSRYYNRARRIHPRDSVSQLGYYIPNSSQFQRNSFEEKQPPFSNSSSPSYSAQSFGTSSSATSGREHRTSEPRVAKYVRKRRWDEKPSSASILEETSGISEPTQAESLVNLNNLKPLTQSNWSNRKLINSHSKAADYHLPAGNQITFEDSPAGSRWRAQKRPTTRGKSSRGAFQLSEQVAAGESFRPTPFMKGAHNPSVSSRMKKRNFHRHNRRMLTSNYDEQYINPYALSELFSQSEIPGFREIFASDSYLRKFCWVVAFLFMTVLSLNDMTELVTEFYDYPITVKVRHIDSSRLPFPAVTVCNLNVVRFSALCSSSNKFDLFKQIPSELREKLCGVQVEKKKNVSDSDISDINNIGITTTSSTTMQPASSPEANEPTNGSTSEATTQQPPASSGYATTPSVSKTSNRKTEHSGNGAEHKSTPTSPESSPAPTSGQVSDKPAASGSSTASPQSTTRRMRVTANGALDLGPDFVDSALPVMDKQLRSRAGRLAKRSIGLAGRPFASSSGPLQVASLEVPLELSKQQQVAGKQANRLESVIRGSSPPGMGVTQATVQNQNPFLPGPNNPFGAHVTPGTPLPGTTGGANSASTLAPPSALPDDFELTERQERELQENLTNWLAVMYNREPKLTRLLGHQFDDMLMRCTIKSINCTHQRSFENSFTPTEGNCFTYRSKVKRRNTGGRPNGAGNGMSASAGSSQLNQQQQAANKQSLVSVQFEEANLAGPAQGLELVLNLEKNEYISGSSQVGALVMIHHPSDLGYAASEATFVAPEFTTYIGLKMVNITRLPAPYPEYCVDNWPEKFADTLTRNSTYSQQACLKICLQKTIQSHCQCQSAQLPIVELDSSLAHTSFPSSQPSSAAQNQNNSSSSNKTAQPAKQATQEFQQRIIICDTRKPATRHCVKDVMVRAADRVHKCECPPKCQVVRYDKTISMAKWPTREDKVTFDRGKMDVNFQNLAKVIVYFQTMTCEEVSQQAVFNAAKLFSALGGIMGMYVGFSFLSIFEIFEVMSRKMWHHFKVKLSYTSSRFFN